MKNQIQKLLIVAIFISGVTFSCKKDDGPDSIVDCSEAATAFTDALNTYGADPSVENCKKYVSAIRTYLRSDCFGAVLRDEYEKELEELEDDCQ